MRNILAVTLVAALLAAAGASAARKPPLPLGHTCVTKAERKAVVRFAAADRTRLIGVHWRRGTKTVVLAHQGGGDAPGNLCAWVPYARKLAARGYSVFAFDHRARGFADMPAKTVNYRRFDLDVMAAVKVVRARGATSVILGGASLGGSASLSATASISPAVQGVFTIGAPAVLTPLDGVAAMRRSLVPVLLMAAAGDQHFPDDARQLYDAAAAPDKRIEIVPGNGHGSPVLERPDAAAIVDGWIDAHA